MARGDTRKAAQEWLKKQGIVSTDELDEQQYELVRKLIGDPSFGIFCAMLRFRAVESSVVLRNTPLGTPERDCAASVLQGHIREIDDIHSLILDIAEPEYDAAEAKEQGDGRSNQ